MSPGGMLLVTGGLEALPMGLTSLPDGASDSLSDSHHSSAAADPITAASQVAAGLAEGNNSRDIPLMVPWLSGALLHQVLHCILANWEVCPPTKPPYLMTLCYVLCFIGL